MINSIKSDFFLENVPFWTPCVQTDKCEVDKEKLIFRIITATTIAFASLFTSLYKMFTPGAPLTLAAVVAASPTAPLLLALSILSAGYIALELHTQERLADIKAVNEYLDPTISPSYSAVYRISNSLYAAKELVKHKGNVNRLSSDKESLLTSANLEVFKFLLDNGAKITTKLDNDKTCLIYLSLDHLQYLVECKQKGKIQINPQDFSASEQAHVWIFVKTTEAAFALKNLGFDPNVKNGNMDVLTYLASHTRNRHIELSTHIEILRRCGISKSDQALKKAPLEQKYLFDF